VRHREKDTKMQQKQAISGYFQCEITSHSGLPPNATALQQGGVGHLLASNPAVVPGLTG
jgi:hypothetical protein